MTRHLPKFLTLAAAISLAACSSEQPAEDTDLTQATTESEAEALADSIPAGDFMELQLGAKVVGPQGPEVEAAFSNEAGNFADVRSYVACPAGMDKCDPNSAPKGTIYTYVHVVTPGEDNDEDHGSGKGVDSSRVERATAFLMTKPAHGFTGVAGYAKAEAASAMGPMGEVVITCDAGQIIWTLTSGDGGNQWENQEPITFYWQSTLPPAGPANAYEIRADYNAAKGKGPYPTNADGAKNACHKVVPPGS